MRTLASGLKIHVQPGIGTTAPERTSSARAERARILRGEIEPLLVEAIRSGASLDEFPEAAAAR